MSKNISKFLLLKPLTATSATLTVMSTGVILQIEKQLLGQTDRTFTSEDSSNVTEAEGQNWHGLMSRLCSNKLSKVQNVNYTGIEVHLRSRSRLLGKHQESILTLTLNKSEKYKFNFRFFLSLIALIQTTVTQKNLTTFSFRQVLLLFHFPFIFK